MEGWRHFYAIEINLSSQQMHRWVQSLLRVKEAKVVAEGAANIKR